MVDHCVDYYGLASLKNAVAASVIVRAFYAQVFRQYAVFYRYETEESGVVCRCSRL